MTLLAEVIALYLLAGVATCFTMLAAIWVNDPHGVELQQALDDSELTLPLLAVGIVLLWPFVWGWMLCD